MKTISALATVTVIGATLAIAGSAVTADAEPYHQERVMRLTAQTDQDAFVDVGTPGPGLGDQIISSDHLLRDGRAFGTDGVVCTIVKAAPDSLTCSWTMTMALPDGQITLQGIADGPAGPPTEPLAFDLAVTGGTGRYRNTRGFAAITDSPGGVEVIDLHLR